MERYSKEWWERQQDIVRYLQECLDWMDVACEAALCKLEDLHKEQHMIDFIHNYLCITETVEDEQWVNEVGPLTEALNKLLPEL